MLNIITKRKLAAIAILSGVLILMTFSGIGFIPLPLINATTMHIPVILGAVLLGPMAGGILGGVFGILSIWINYTAPISIIPFAFSPLLANDASGAIKALWIGLCCRILLGVVAGWLWKIMKGIHANDFIALPLVAAISSIWHTISVMGSIYFLFAQEYAQAMDVSMSAVSGLVMDTVITAGIPEAIAAAILVTVTGKITLIIKKHI